MSWISLCLNQVDHELTHFQSKNIGILLLWMSLVWDSLKVKRGFVSCSLIHAYAVGRDMEEALSCVRKMKEEGIEMSLVTYSVIVGAFSKAGNAE